MRLAILIITVVLATPVLAQSICEEPLDTRVNDLLPSGPSDELHARLLKYATLAQRHKLGGLASYYSSSLDGLPTATGEIFRNRKLTAAHLTLPLGTWVEVTSRATKRMIRCRVNDRGPYARKFFLDLSQAAARALGVDRNPDRYVSIRVIALPGEEPLPENATCPAIDEQIVEGPG